MSCEEIENQIPDYQENQLSRAQREEVETHLARCVGCRTLAHELQQLDGILSVGIEIPALPAAFDRRLRERIQAVPIALSEAQRAERKRQLQADYEAGMARISRGSFLWGNLRDHLTWPALGILAGCLAWRITWELTANLTTKNLDSLAPNLLPWMTASAIVLAVGLTDVIPRRWTTFRVW